MANSARLAGQYVYLPNRPGRPYQGEQALASGHYVTYARLSVSHVTGDRLEEVNLLSKFQLPSS